MQQSNQQMLIPGRALAAVTGQQGLKNVLVHETASFRIRHTLILSNSNRQMGEVNQKLQRSKKAGQSVALIPGVPATESISV